MALTLSSDVGQSFTGTPKPLILVTNGPLGMRASTNAPCSAPSTQAASARRAPWRAIAQGLARGGSSGGRRGWRSCCKTVCHGARRAWRGALSYARTGYGRPAGRGQSRRRYGGRTTYGRTRAAHTPLPLPARCAPARAGACAAARAPRRPAAARGASGARGGTPAACAARPAAPLPRWRTRPATVRCCASGHARPKSAGAPLPRTARAAHGPRSLATSAQRCAGAGAACGLLAVARACYSCVHAAAAA